MTTTNQHNQGIKKPLYWIFALCFILYGNSIQNEYALDDAFVTVAKESHPTYQLVSRGIAAIPTIFKTHYAKDPNQSYDYRPLVTSSFAIEYQIFGRNPHVSHFINVLLYALCCWLLFKVLSGTSLWGIRFAEITVLLFILFPVHSEVVNNLKSRDELMTFVFGISSLLSFTNYFKSTNKKYLLYGFLWFLAAMLTKRTSIIYVLLIPICLHFLQGISWKRFLPIVGICILAAASFVAIKQSLVSADDIRKIQAFENPLVEQDGGLFSRIPFAAVVFWKYVQLLIAPLHLSYYYGYNEIPLVGWGDVVAWIALLSIAGLLVLAWLKHRKDKILWFAIMFFFVAMAGYSNIVMPVVGILAERFVFVGSIGGAVILSWVFFKLSKTSVNQFFEYKYLNKNIRYILLAVIVAYSTRIWLRNPDWKSEKTLFSNDLKHLKKSVKANVLYADVLRAELFRQNNGVGDERIDDAIRHYQKALELYPNHISAINSIAFMDFAFRGNKKAPIEMLHKALVIDSNHAKTHFNLGVLYQADNQFHEAIHHYRWELSIDSNNPDSFGRLQKCLMNVNDTSEALSVNLSAMKQFPSIPDFPINVANIWGYRGDTLKAIDYFEMAIQINPSNTKLNQHLQRLKSEQGIQ